jgi:hypothetical protein
MESNTNTNFNSQTNQHTELAPIAKVGETIASLTVFDYLGGLAVTLIFLAITRMITQSRFCKRSRKCSDVAFLERIWKMDASKINH